MGDATATTAVVQRAQLRGPDRRHRFPGRAHRLTPRFTEAELAEIAAAAAALGVTTTGFCAETALAAARGAPPASVGSVDREAIAALQSELFAAEVAVNRVGTNLNQAVAALNATGEAPVWLAAAVALCARAVRRLDEVVSRIDRRLR